jgi:hypothetical protein
MGVLFLRRASPEAIPGASWPAGILRYLPAAIRWPVETSIVTLASVSITGRSVVVPHSRGRSSCRAHQVFGEGGPQVWVVFRIQRISVRREVDVLPSVDVSRAAAAGDIEVWIDAQVIASNMSFPTLGHAVFATSMVVHIGFSLLRIVLPSMDGER